MHDRAMTLTDYLVNAALVALVVLQVRGRRLSTRQLLFPIAIVVWAAFEYLHGVPTAGASLVLVLAGATAGLFLGVGAALATRVYPNETGSIMAKAGPLAAALWVLGTGGRLAFELYATHGGAGAIGRFSAAHGVTSGEAWVACLVLMALLEVVGRSSVLALRYRAAGGELTLAGSQRI